MAAITPIGRTARDPFLHREFQAYRNAVRRELDAYHRFIQLGLVAQGILLALAITVPRPVWARVGSWRRSVRSGIVPSEAVVAIALRNALPHFLADDSRAPDLARFLQQHIDPKQTQARRLAA